MTEIGTVQRANWNFTFHLNNLAPFGSRGIDLYCDKQDYHSAMTLAVTKRLWSCLNQLPPLGTVNIDTHPWKNQYVCISLQFHISMCSSEGLSWMQDDVSVWEGCLGHGSPADAHFPQRLSAPRLTSIAVISLLHISVQKFGRTILEASRQERKTCFLRAQN